jgi:pimeloyl-ACP methyl ester carboxylesterase
MGDEFSTLPRVRPVKGKAQWAGARYLQIEEDGTIAMSVPFLMPGTVIFVHGVNSQGEWYQEAARQLCAGLNERLGRTDLVPGARSPIIPFYWGYKMQPGDEARYPGLFHGEDNAWGGGPFQNGTNNLLQFWQDGFRRKVLNGVVDLQRLNGDITRQLQDAPARTYFVHAAKRLANLVDTMREDFPNEPLNIVAHSQGNMITLCAMLYVKRRAPDTLILNGAPYCFDVKITDWLSAASGWSDVQSSRARLRTFQAVACKIAAAKSDYKDDEASAACPSGDASSQAGVYLHHQPECDNWHDQIGRAPVNSAGQCWNECGHTTRDNRGKVFVNFNPHDRVIGISAIEGIGWRGIPEHILGPGQSKLPNVYQRVFARNSGLGDVPAVGGKSGYWFTYFHTQFDVAEDVTTTDGTRLTTSDGSPVQTRNDQVRTYDDKPRSRFWNILPAKVAGLFSVQSTPGWTEKVWINAPIVPKPAVIREDFNEGTARFDGTDDDREAQAQREDFAAFSRHYVPEATLLGRRETPDEVKKKLAGYGQQTVPKTNHGTILTYGKDLGQDELVRQVISYDLTVGQGYAFGDAAYWQYLLDLANWKVSDPYYKAGVLPPAGSYPAGLDLETAMPKPSRIR